MPELPEVETIVRGLNQKVRNRTFLDVWTDSPKTVRKPSFEIFKKELKGKKIQNVWRRAKNILFDLSGGKILLVHQKMTGHLLYGKWEFKDKKWIAKNKGPLKDDPMNRFLHLVFTLDNGFQLALSDLRKFAKIELWNDEDFRKSEYLKNLGLEPLDKSFTFKKFKEVFTNKKGKIKIVLLDQSVIAGIGNIYADEILWETKIHPLRNVSQLSESDFKNIYRAIRKILQKAVKLRGSSLSDFRDLAGEKGTFGKIIKAYRREGLPCFRCKTKLKRIKINARSSCFCPQCQILA